MIEAASTSRHASQSLHATRSNGAARASLPGRASIPGVVHVGDHSAAMRVTITEAEALAIIGSVHGATDLNS
jgi:hypothetical protein